jgi:predicted  nucleic acid-binding Zn-ribbon protein
MWRSRAGAILAVVAALLAVKLLQEGYRWYAYGDQRDQIREMTHRLEDLGYRVIRTQLAADSLRDQIESVDTELDRERRRMDAMERRATLGALTHQDFERYRVELDAFNQRIGERNARLSAWQEVISENHDVVSRYNQLADSIRAVAATMGEPYFDVPAPVDMAARRGLTAPR